MNLLTIARTPAIQVSPDSTVMEAVAAHWAGTRVCGVSLVTNAGAGMSPTPLTHAEVVEAADEAGPRLAQVVGRFAEELLSVG